MKAKANSKIILFGEYSVLFGCLGIAASINMECDVTFNYNSTCDVPTNSIKRIFPSEYNLKKAIEHYQKTHYHSIPLAYITKELLYKYDIEVKFPLFYSINSEIPIGMGVGSSSAIFGAFTLALLKHLKVKTNNRDIKYLIDIGDTIAHGGKASGIDSTIIITGKCISYKIINNEFEVKNTDSFYANFLLVDTGISRSVSNISPQIIKYVKEKGKLFLGELDDIALKGWESIYQNDFNNLEYLIMKNGDLLDHIMKNNGYSFNNIRNDIINFGYRGVKISGGGGGGYLLVFNSDQNYLPLINFLKRRNIKSKLVKTAPGGLL